MPRNQPGFAGSRQYVPTTTKTPRRRISLSRLLPMLSLEKRIVLRAIWMLIKALFSQRLAEQIAVRAEGFETAERYQQLLAIQESNQHTKH